MVALLEPLALAYVGPGAGLSMIGTLLAVVAVLLLALLAPLFYVLQLVWTLMRGRTSASKTDQPG